MIYILEGLIIGMLVSLPIGPLGILSVQRTVNMGWKVGFLSGIGVALSDMIYSSTAVFGISFIDVFVKEHRFLISWITGILFLVFGLKIIINSFHTRTFIEEKKEKLHPTLSIFLIGFSNPLTFLIFITIFTKIGLEISANDLTHNLLFIGSIFTGSLVFWFVTTYLINHTKRNLKIETLYLINKVIGMILVLFGTFSITQGIFQF